MLPGLHRELRASLDYIENLSQKSPGLGMKFNNRATCTIGLRKALGWFPSMENKQQNPTADRTHLPRIKLEPQTPQLTLINSCSD